MQNMTHRDVVTSDTSSPGTICCGGDLHRAACLAFHRCLRRAGDMALRACRTLHAGLPIWLQDTAHMPSG